MVHGPRLLFLSHVNALPSLCLLSVRYFQKEKSEDKEHRQTGNRHVYCTARQLHSCNNDGAEKGSSFGKNIVDTEIFTGIFSRYNLGIVGA